MIDMDVLKKVLVDALQHLEGGEVEESDFYSFLPEELIDTFQSFEEYRSVDECIAVHAIQYPELHDLMRKFVDSVAAYNRRTILWDDSEHAGGAIARELALHSKDDVSLFARFISSNDLNHEVDQAEDMEAVLKKWGPCRETYSVVAARWFTPGQHRDEFDYDSVIDSIKSEEDVEIFMDAVAQWFGEGWFPSYTIHSRYDDVVELLTMIFGGLDYSESKIESLIAPFID